MPPRKSSSTAPRAVSPGVRRAGWWPAAALVALACAAYVPVTWAGLIWDDESHITFNRTLRSPAGWREIWFQPGATPQYYPLVHTCFRAEYQLWGEQPLGYHLLNVALHAGSAVLVWRLLLRLAVPGAWLAAALFAVHPVEVESVAWITERKNVLSLFLALLSLLAYFRYAPPDETAVGGARRRYYWASLALFVAALLAKTVTASLPAVILVIAWWKRGIRRHDVLRLAPLFVIGFALAMMTVWMEKHHVKAQGPEWDLSAVQRCLIAGRALWFYAAKLAWPARLTFFYPRWEIDPAQAWQYAYPAAAAAVIAGLWLARGRIGRGPLAAVLIFAGVLVPALGFINVYPMRYSFVADHFQYHASIALVALFAAGGVRLAAWLGPRARVPAAAVAGVLLAALAGLTWRQCLVYENLETLYLDVLAKNPASWAAHTNLAGELLEQGRVDDALSHYRQALVVRPGHSEAHAGIGLVHSKRGELAEAVEQYRAALADRADHPLVHNELAAALAALGRLDEAEAECREAIRLKPDLPEARSGLGLILLARGQAAEAAVELERAVKLRPDRADYYFHLGNALAAANRFQPAAARYAQATRLNPRYAEAYNNLGGALLNLGQTDQAIAQFETALRLQPTYADAQANLERAWQLKRGAP